MRRFNPYLNLGGKAREALAFYAQCFQGEVTELMTFAEAKLDVPEAFQDAVIHASFKAEGIHFMVSDGQPGEKIEVGNTVTLAIHQESEAEQATLFALLGEGGEVTMPLGDTFWNARYGELTDRYGIRWMFNCQKSVG